MFEEMCDLSEELCVVMCVLWLLRVLLWLFFRCEVGYCGDEDKNRK